MCEDGVDQLAEVAGMDARRETCVMYSDDGRCIKEETSRWCCCVVLRVDVRGAVVALLKVYVREGANSSRRGA